MAAKKKVWRGRKVYERWLDRREQEGWSLADALRIFVARAPVDFRKAHDGLSQVVRDVFGDDPLSACLDVKKLTPHGWKEHFLPVVETRRHEALLRLFATPAE